MTENKGDLISREALLKRVDEERKYLIARGQTGAEHILVHNFRDLIDNAPTVELERPQGEITEEDIQNAIKTGYENGYSMAQAKYQRPQGEWIYTDKEDKEKGYGGYCSNCKCDMPIGMNDWKQEYYESNFCPNCGAEMKGGAE